MVRAVTIKELKSKICVSPADPNAEELIERLKRAGINFSTTERK